MRCFFVEGGRDLVLQHESWKLVKVEINFLRGHINCEHLITLTCMLELQDVHNWCDPLTCLFQLLLIFTIHVVRRDLFPAPQKSTTHTVESLKFSRQPDDGLHTGPKHVFAYYISLRHHHHVLEGLGMLACSLILQMKLVPPSLPTNPTPTSTKAKAAWPLGNAAKTAADGRGCRRKSSALKLGPFS